MNTLKNKTDRPTDDNIEELCDVDEFTEMCSDREFQKQLLKRAQWKTHNREDGAELTQDVLLKAFSSREQFKKGSNFKAWVFKILDNLFINMVRKPTLTTLDINGEYNRGVDKSIMMNPENVDLRFSSKLYDKIDSLGEEQQLLLSLIADGYKYAEIAAMLGIPEGTILSRMDTIRNTTFSYTDKN